MLCRDVRRMRAGGEGACVTTLLEMPLDPELPFAFFAVAVLAVTVALGYALRADSPGAPTNYREAAATPDFPGAMLTEIENHRHNESWTVIDRTEVPSGRRLHNLTWVFKHKRCGKAKARLCVQGCTMIPQIEKN